MSCPVSIAFATHGGIAFATHGRSTVGKTEARGRAKITDLGRCRTNLLEMAGSRNGAMGTRSRAGTHVHPRRARKTV
jgi:hypothetical protein